MKWELKKGYKYKNISICGKNSLEKREKYFILLSNDINGETQALKTGD
jgi:hypothetical protein